MLTFHRETPRLILRPLIMTDAPSMLEYLNDPEVVRFLRVPQKHTVAECEEIIKNRALPSYAIGQPRPIGIVYKDEGKLIGTVALREVDREAQVDELSYVISRAYWGRGITAEAVQAMLHWGFMERHLNRIQATCVTANDQSWRVMEKCGLTQEGILRQYMKKGGHFYDHFMYAILRQDWLSSNSVK